MKIALYGGSFNPIHKGHIEVAKHIIKSMELDKLIFVPAFKSPFKKKEVYEKAEHRMQMVQDILEEKMAVSAFEINRKGTSYTIDTVKYFKSKYPQAQLFLVIGTDQLYKLHKWKQVAQVVEMAEIIVYRRQGSFSKLNIKKYNCKLMDNQLYDFSSTAFRNGDFSQIADTTAAYIGKNHLYMRDLLLGMTEPKRHKHCVETGKLAASYAKMLNIDVKQAWIAGTFHDITKNWPPAKHREFLTSLDIDETKLKDFELHSLTGSLWMKHVYQINDEAIVTAIRKHTSLAKDLTILDKVVFAADKLSVGRRHDGVQEERQMMRDDFESGFKILTKNTYLSLATIGRNISAEQKEVYEFLVGEKL